MGVERKVPKAGVCHYNAQPIGLGPDSEAYFNVPF